MRFRAGARRSAIDWDWVPSLAGALIGGAAAIWAAVLSTRLLRRAEIAEAFVARVGGAVGGIEYAEAVLRGEIEGDKGKVVGDARYLLGEIRPTLAVVRLRHRKGRDAAEQVFTHLEKAIKGLEAAVKEPPGHLENVKADRDKADAALTEFSRARGWSVRL